MGGKVAGEGPSGPRRRPEADERRRRQADALRANLRRRKTQAQARRSEQPEDGPADTEPGGEEAPRSR